MPKPLQVDWEMIKTRYITGSLPKELSQEFGVAVRTLNKRITRGDWVKLKTAARQNVGNLVRISLEEASKKVKENLAVEVLARTESLQRIPSSETLADIGTRAEIANELATVGDRVFGWRESGAFPQPLVNIAMLSDEPAIIVPMAHPVIELGRQNPLEKKL